MWAVLHEHGAGWRKKEGTKRYWETLSEKEQAQAYTTITEKLADGRFGFYRDAKKRRKDDFLEKNFTPDGTLK